MSRRILFASVGGALLAAGALAAALALTVGGSKKATTEPTTAVTGVTRVQQMLAGVPQQGTALGSPSAPVTLVEFADPQCPYCGEWARLSLPTIVRKYVRTQKVRIDFAGLTFVGADSDTAMRTALAAARQGRFWNVLELLFENQGTENTGWVTDSLVRSIGTAVPGLDVQKMLDQRSAKSVGQALSRAAQLAQTAGVQSTPTFAVGKTGGVLQVVHVSSLEPSGLTPSLDAALGK